MMIAVNSDLVIREYGRRGMVIPKYSVLDRYMKIVFSTDSHALMKLWLDTNGYELDFTAKGMANCGWQLGSKEKGLWCSHWVICQKNLSENERKMVENWREAFRR